MHELVTSTIPQLISDSDQSPAKIVGFCKVERSLVAFSHVRRALHCVNAIEVSAEKSRTIRLHKQVPSFVCIVCMRSRMQT